MIIILKKDFQQSQLHDLVEKIKNEGGEAHVVRGEDQVTISVIGRTERMNLKEYQAHGGVEQVIQVSKPYKLVAGRKTPKPMSFSFPDHEDDGNFIVMAGPCSVETEEQTIETAKIVKAAGATVLRGGAYKPRTSPYSFQGLGVEGFRILDLARRETGLKIISEIMDLTTLEIAMPYVDIIQIGARNMQNFPLLKELGKVNKPILLKRGPSATIDEWLLSAEYILSGGNEKVILCERGVKGFDNTHSRNTLDLNAVPIVKHLTQLPIIVDPSHGTGYRHLVSPMSLASMAAGADGIIVEVHNKPEKALSDGPQALLFSDFQKLMKDLKNMSQALDRKICTLTAKQQEKISA